MDNINIVIILSVFFGLIFGKMIGQQFTDNQRNFHGPNSRDVRRAIHYDPESDRYFKLEPFLTFCPLT